MENPTPAKGDFVLTKLYGLVKIIDIDESQGLAYLAGQETHPVPFENLIPSPDGQPNRWAIIHSPV
jgi:hypothetical protein